MPVIRLEDIGIDQTVLNTIEGDGLLSKLEKQLYAASSDSSDVIPSGNWHLQALSKWQQGCDALLSKKWELALSLFKSADDKVGDAPLYRVSQAIANAGKGDMVSANNLLWDLEYSNLDDNRLNITKAMIGLNRKLDSLDLTQASQVIKNLIDALIVAGYNDIRNLSQLVDKNVINNLRNNDPEVWEAYKSLLIRSEQLFFGLLWQERFSEAEQFAKEINDIFWEFEITSLKWLEHIGDSYFFMQRYPESLDYYERATIKNPTTQHIYLKMSDVYHLLGDAEQEKFLREKIYGAFEYD